MPSRGTATAMTIALPYTGPLERYRIPRRRLPLAIGIVGALAAGVVAAVVVDRGEDTPVAPPSRAEVRFLVEPSDATVLLDGAARSGELELAAGSYAVEVRRAGYRSWVSTLEVVGGENQTLRIPLLPGGSAMAHMIIASSPSGLAVTLDGAPLDQPTPVTLEVAAGQHTIALAQAGRPVWQRSFTAAADTQYEFHPVLEAAPEVARPARSPARRAARGAEATVVLEDFRWTRPPEAPAGPAAASSDPLTRPELVPLPVKVDDPPAAPRRDAGQAVVRPEAVKRLSGSLPTLSARHADDVPRRITAKLCIDERGRVESATVLGKVPSAARRKLVDAMERWRYAPYQSGGVATPVCFAPSFQLAAD